MNDEITLTKPQLQAALRQWEIDARTGKTKTREETAAMDIDACARECADTLWSLLAPVTA